MSENGEDIREEVKTPEAVAEESATPEAAEAPAEEIDPLAKMLSELTESQDMLLRHRAEFENFRKRKAKEMEQLRVTAAEGLILDLLPVIDNLERALAHVEDPNDALAQGVDMVVKQFHGILRDKGLEPVDAVGLVFDPNVHEALAQQPSDEHAEDTVMLEYERGYRLGDKVARPAKVVVSSGPAVTDETTTDAGGDAASE